MKPLLFWGVAPSKPCRWDVNMAKLRWQSLVDDWNIPYLGRDLRNQALGIAMAMVGTPTIPE